MAKQARSEFKVERDHAGRFYWRLIGADGRDVRIVSGSAPGLRRRKGYAAIDDAVQSALGSLYEEQRSSAV